MAWQPKSATLSMGYHNYKQLPLQYVEQEENNQRVISAALDALDTVTREMDQRWGIDQLPKLVDPDTSAKFERARQNLEYAIVSKDVNLVVLKANNLLKGWRMLNRIASENGELTLDQDSPVIWYHRGPNHEKYAIVKDPKDLTKVKSSACDRVYCLDEICRILAFFEDDNGLVKKIKGEFLGCEIKELNHTKKSAPKPNWAPF